MRICIIDDDRLVTSSLKTILEAGGMEVCGVGYSGEDAISLYEKQQPDVLLMDIRMTGMNGVEASDIILQRHKDASILFLTTFSDDEYIIKALQIGVKGYILKQNFDGILASIEAVALGQNVFNTEIMTRIPCLMDKQEDFSSYDLNEREQHILSLVGKGMNNKEIANTLFLSEGTVRNYISALLDKLDLRDRTQLAVFYYQHIKGNE